MVLKVFFGDCDFPNEFLIEPIFYPFGDANNWDQRFLKYAENSKFIFQITSLEEADLVIMPVNWEVLLSADKQHLGFEYIANAKQLDKTTLSFFGGDCSHRKLEVESDLMFRHSLYSSIKSENDFAMPAWSEDILQEHLNGEIILREKKTKPKVGFCGFTNRAKLSTYAKYHLVNNLHRLKRRYGVASIPPYSSGHILRNKALNYLEKSSGIDCNFIRRERSVFFKEENALNRKKMREEFVRNMVDSDYVFCCRGSGNYSFRFYEALSCGRIPVLLNTDCSFPLDFKIDWKRYCVWVEEHELSQMDQKIREFHEALSPSEFIGLQKECRFIWETYIEPSAFFGSLDQHLFVRESLVC